MVSVKSLPLVLILSVVALVGCAKDKSKNAQATASSPAAALSSNDQCAMMACQKPKSATTSSASAISTSTAVVVSAPVAPSAAVDAPAALDSPAEPAAPVPPAPVVNKKPAAPAPATADPFFLDAQRMAKYVMLDCVNGDCDPSVGLLSVTLLYEGAWNVGQCTASLIGPDMLVTNGHCIPQDLEANGSSCANRMWINFADETGHPEFDKQVGCKQVLFRRKDGGLNGADYAYIQLERAVNRPVLRQSQAGFENNKRYHLHKINPIHPPEGQLDSMPDGMRGQMQKVDCLSLYDSAIFSQRLDARSQTSFFVDCQVLSGNSGSPLLDDQGSVRGVISAFEKKDLLRQSLDKYGSTVPSLDEIADLNVGSNFACLTLPGDPDGRNLSPACANGLERLGQERALEHLQLANALKPAVKKMIAEKAPGHPDVLAFGWSISTSTSDALGTVGQGVPDCVVRSAAGKLSNADSKIHRPFFHVRATYDKYLRISNPAPVWAGFAKTAENLHLGKATDGATFQLDITDQATGQSEFNSALGYCQ